MITATNFATRIRRENYIYTLSHCRQNRARVKGGIKKLITPPLTKSYRKQRSRQHVCSREFMYLIVLVVVLQSNFFTFSGFNHWNNFVIILYEIPSTRSWYKQSRQNKTIFKPTKNYINQRERGKIEAAPPGWLTQPKKCTSSRCIKSALQSQDFFFCRGEWGDRNSCVSSSSILYKIETKVIYLFFSWKI